MRVRHIIRKDKTLDSDTGWRQDDLQPHPREEGRTAMIDMQSIQETLCRTLCSTIDIAAVPCGYAISTAFEDASGDRLRFYALAEDGRIHLEDSGDFLATLKASGIDFDSGQRGVLLNQVLGEGEAYWDHDNFEIRTDDFPEDELAARAVKFTAALLRATAIRS
mgnify:CR=1 FL=1